MDYVALDVKTSLEKYGLLGAKDTVGLMRTVEILKTGKVPYEFRTTRFRSSSRLRMWLALAKW